MVMRSFVPLVARLVLASTLVSSGTQALAADTYQSGRINNITTTTQGLMLMLDTGMPTQCAGSPYGWMLIPEANKTMVATALALWLSGVRDVTVYVNAYSGSGFCVINQLDPA
jgi:uncharacterized membrane protein YphA (DoxX/SURF4 family)